MNPDSLTTEQREAALKAMASCLTALKESGLGPKESAGVLLEMSFQALTHRSSIEQAIDYMHYGVADIAMRHGSER